MQCRCAMRHRAERLANSKRGYTMTRTYTGIDVGKSFYWMRAVGESGRVILGKRTDQSEKEIKGVCSRLVGLGDVLVVIDLANDIFCALDSWMIGPVGAWSHRRNGHRRRRSGFCRAAADQAWKVLRSERVKNPLKVV